MPANSVAGDRETPRRGEDRRRRLVTGAVAVPLALLAVFLLPGAWFFPLALAMFLGAAFEFVKIGRHWAPSAPLVTLPIAVASISLAIFYTGGDLGRGLTGPVALWLVAGGGTVVLIAAATTLLSTTAVDEAAAAIGLLAFGLPYFTLAALVTGWLQAEDPWLLLLLLLIVWMGDIAAFYAGSRFGRHKLAPEVSPKKSWEGAIAGFGASVLAAALWSFARLGSITPSLLGLAALTAVVAQMGDLVESLFKRGAGVKDSSHLLPGHGGLLDRLDAMLLAAPVFLAGIWLTGHLAPP